MHKGRARPETGGEAQKKETRTPKWRAQRWFGVLVLAPLLVSGALLLLYGCTLPVQGPGPMTPDATAALPTGAIGEPEVVLLPVIKTEPLAAPRVGGAAGLATPAEPAALPVAARPEPEPAAATEAHAPLLGLAGAALAATTRESGTGHFPTTPALPVSPLPTSETDTPAAPAPAAPAPIATLSITEALAATLPGPDAPNPVDPVEASVEVGAAAPSSAPVAAPATTPDYAPDGVARTAHVPILMYHYISTPPGDADIYRRDLSVAPDLFAAQLDRLLADGYTAISLYDLMANLGHGAPLPEKPVVLTFDDGYRDLYENALPALSARAMKATVFVLTDFMDEGRPEYLTWDMARAMLAAGISIESHGRNHVSLEGKDNDYLIWQALGSDQTIEFELGVRPRFVSYPAGDFDQQVINIFQSANYWAGVTTEQGATQSSDDLFRLPRIRVRGTTTPDDLARLLKADW